MTVAELIEALKQMPQDTQVYSHLPYSDILAKIQSPNLMYTDEDDQQVEWAFFKENADDSVIIEDYIQIVTL